MADVVKFNDVESFDETVSPSNKARKRKRNADKWKKNIKKKELYSAGGKTAKIGCNHGARLRHRGAVCNVNKLSAEDIDHFFDAFHKNETKKSQDAFLLQHIFVCQVRKRRVLSQRKSKKNALFNIL